LIRLGKSMKVAAVSILAAAALFMTVSATTQGGIPFPDVFAVCNGSSGSHTDIPQEPNVESAIVNLPSEQISGQA
jgi:hypothetical protein